MNGSSSQKTALNSYTEYLCELRWSLVIRDSIVDDRSISDLRHSAFRTYYRDAEDIREIFNNLSSDELIMIALMELHYLADISDHGNIRVPVILETWLELNGSWFLKAFALLCTEAKDWEVHDLQLALKKKLTLETGEA